MKNIQGIIFDMDGVIFDTERVYLDTWRRVFKKYDYEFRDEVYISVMGTGRSNVKKVFIENYGDNLPIAKMYDDKDEMFFEIINEGKVPVKKGAIEILQYLKNENYKVALATSAKRVRTEKQIKYKEIYKYFDSIICGDDVYACKPNPEIFLKASSSIEVEPKKCIVIEDSEAGVKCAYNANMNVIHVEDLKKADSNIKNITNKYFKNLVEVKEYIEKNVNIA